MAQPPDKPSPDSAAPDTAPPAAEPAPGRDRSPRRIPPPRRGDRATAWLLLAACLLLAAAPILIGLTDAGPRGPRETHTLATATETWQHQDEFSYDTWSLEPLVPWHNDEPQLDTAPALTWFHLLTLAPLDRDTPRPQHRMMRHRLVSVAFGLLTVAAVYWAGFSIGGIVTATMAALVCLACPVLLFYSRIATPDIAAAGLVSFAVAAAVWAIRPLRPAPSLLRQGIGWTLCGLTMGLATLTGGLVTLAAVLLPLVLILILCPHRLPHALGLVAAVCLAGLITTPWAVHVHEQNPDVWRAWIETLVPGHLERPQQLAALVGERLALLLLALLPWTAWLAAGLVQPFSTSSAGSRMRMFLGWVWFVPTALLLLVVPGEPRLGALLLALPAGAVLTGQVIRQYLDLSAEGRHARIWRWLRWPHTAVLGAVSVLLPAAAHLQGRLVAEGWLRAPLLAPMHELYWAGAGLALLGLTALSVRYVLRHYPGKAVLCWSLWTVAAFVAVITPLTRGPWLNPPPPTTQTAAATIHAEPAPPPPSAAPEPRT